uniref:FtsK/SpoIIIE domain-containing protein n=1 Tax=Mediterraneibacter glycyrrhizinilyticus TaxID=342942 RepID=UPI0013DE0BD4
MAVIILALCVIFSMLFSYVKNFPLKILLLCVTTVIMLILSFALFGWAIRNRIDRGLKYAWKHYVLVLRLRKELLNAGIYTMRKIGVEKVAVIPWITVNFAPDFKSGRIYIKNSIQFHEKLAKIDISSALGGYVVEQVYLTDNEDHYYYEFYDAHYEKRLVFQSFGEFQEYSDSTGDYELFIDRDTTLSLTHQLLVGQTGSGKSYALFGYILQMLGKQIPYHLYFADPKSSSIELLGEKISPDNTASDFEGIVSLLERFVFQMEERQKEIKKRLSTMIDGDYRDFDLSPHVLIFDEFSAFSQQLAEKDKKQRDHVAVCLHRLS